MINKQLTYKGVVYPWHCDHMGHMNVMWYVGKFDEATWAFFATLGLTSTALRDAGRGMAALEQHIVYKREVMAGDTLEINSHLIEIKSKTIRFSHEMIDCATGEVTAHVVSVAVYMDTVARKSALLPEDVQLGAQQMMAAQVI